MDDKQIDCIYRKRKKCSITNKKCEIYYCYCKQLRDLEKANEKLYDIIRSLNEENKKIRQNYLYKVREQWN